MTIAQPTYPITTSNLVTYVGSYADSIAGTSTSNGEYVNLVRDYGVTSGSDITGALQTVAGLSSPRTVYLPAGDYTLSGLVSFTRPVDFVGDGPNATKIRKTADAGQVQWTGTRGSNVALTADAASGASTLSFVTTGFAAGDFLNLHSSETWPWSTAGALHGEIVRIKTVDSGSVVTLYSPTVDAYTVANSATVNKMGFLTGGSIQRMTMYQTGPLSTGTNNGLVRAIYGRGFEARDVTFSGMDQFAVSFDSCLEGTAARLILTDAYWNDATNTYYAYGVLMRGCTQSVTVSNVSARNAQVVNGGGDSSGGPRFIKVADCVGTEGSQLVGDTTIYKPLFATHGDCMEWQFSDCLAYSSRGTAFEIKGSDHVFNSIMAHNISTTGIFCLPESSRITFSNPKIRDINGTGLIITQDSEVHGGSIRDCDSRGLRIDGSGCTVQGTEVRNAGRTGNRDAFYLNTGANNTVLRDITARDMPTATSYVVNGVASLTGNVIHMPRRINVQSGANANVSAAVYTGGTAYTL
jgi:hypothetical protein